MKANNTLILMFGEKLAIRHEMKYSVDEFCYLGEHILLYCGGLLWPLFIIRQLFQKTFLKFCSEERLLENEKNLL